MKRRLFTTFSIALTLAGCTASQPASAPDAAPQLTPLNLETCRSLLRDDESLESLKQAAIRTNAYLDDPGHSVTTLFGKPVSRDHLAAVATTAADALTVDDITNILCDRYTVYRVETSVPLGVATYTELELAARRRREGEYIYPVYEPPSDLVEVDLSAFCPTCEKKVAQGRVAGSRVVPYLTRTEIEQGQLENNDYELGYLSDPSDAYALRLRGTGTLVMDDGTRMHLRYVSANGHPRADPVSMLVKQGRLSRDEATVAGIRSYLSRQPGEAASVLHADEHYAFYALVPVGPVGSLGLPITAGRTIAADSRIYPRGLMGFVRVPGRASRFVFVQDSEVGMEGPDRLGLFVGTGAEPQPAAPAEFYVILPR